MSDASISATPLRTTFQIKPEREDGIDRDCGSGLSVPTNLSSIEWTEFRSLHADAISWLERAADNAMLTVPATNAVRTLFVRANML